MSETWYTDDHATLGDRLAAGRDAAGMTQSQLAQRLGVRAKTLRDWENDVSEPRANRLQMLAALLGVSLRWLLTGEGDDVTPPAAAEAQPNPALKSALSEIRSLRGELLGMGERLGRLEKTLKAHMASETAGSDAVE
ncbi:helix-turn-helix transcriptional regulator [Pararhodobacter sp. CCB-MM2]|uniref:helix-turn-helix domain-containing protein n=1 Tax=Pararhodobacter sp. CCB-MM2 TaxID=1786003 RepID=UPI00082DB89D|nr:helix-turn-helix transcriptional regulator [Pararhodobacter sp. CCB-MM2]MCA2010874.1 helix-turn-helix domain-containing protein [Cereibacter sphaeroides]